MNVLFLSYDGLTDPLGQSQILPYLSGLSDKGANIHIISFEKTERFEKHKSLIEKIVAKNNLIWHPLQYTKHPPVLSTLFDLNKMKNLTKKIVKENNIQIIHSRSYLSALIGNWAKQKLSTKFIFDMRGFWADERVEGKIWNIQNPLFKSIYKFFKNKEKEFLRNADAIISLTHAAKKEMLNWNLNIENNKISVIPCCVDIDFFNRKNIDENNRTKIRNDLNVEENDTLLIYTGGIGTWYCLDEMMQFFKYYNLKNKASKFLLLTAENPLLIFSSATKNHVDEKLLRVLESPRSKMPNYLSAADLALFFIMPSFSKTASSPTKQGEMMAMQLPIICNDNVGDTGFVIRKYQSGWLVNSFEEDELKNVVDTVIHNSSKDILQIRKGAEEFYSLQNGVEIYFSIYKKLTD